MTQVCEKVLVELYMGSFLDLMCKGQNILSGKPSVAYNSSGIQDLISRGKAKLYCTLPEEATQKDFDECLKKHKGNVKKALSEFMKKYSEPEGEAKTEPEGEAKTEPEGEAKTEPEGEAKNNQ